MKKITLLASAFLAFTIAVNAQNATTKVSKQIEVLPWLNAAVIDANQAAGGMHTYADWATLTTDLKLAQVKVGMLVTITGETDGNLNGTFRLSAWGTNTALPLGDEWVKVGDMVVVADLAARDALINATGTHTLQLLAPGTTVVVKANGIGVPESFIYAAGLFDANGDATVDATDLWYSPSSNAASSGYIFIKDQAVGTTTVDLTSGYKAGAIATIAVGTDARLTAMPGDVEYTLAAGATVPVIAMPAAWVNPTFYINDATNTYPLLDCWIKSYQTIDNITYQVWTADNAFLTAATGTLKLFVR